MRITKSSDNYKFKIKIVYNYRNHNIPIYYKEYKLENIIDVHIKNK